MAYTDIKLEVPEKHIAMITLNRPEIRNGWTPTMTKELLSALDEIDSDDEMRVLITTGAGPAFSGGGNIREMAKTAYGEETKPRTVEDIRRGLTRSACLLIPKLQKMQKPTIAMVNGPAVGGGFDFALAHDLRVGSEKTWFMNGFIRLGTLPGYGGCWLYTRVMGLPRALQYLFTKDILDAKEAERIGVLNKLVPSATLLDETLAFARKIANGPPIGMRLTKMLAYRALEMDLETALQMSAALEPIGITSEDLQEGVRAFREHREPNFQGR